MSPGNRSALSAKASQLQAAKTLLKTFPVVPPRLQPYQRILIHPNISRVKYQQYFLCETDESITPPPPLYDDKRSSGEIQGEPLDVTFNIGEDSQYLTILNLLCHRLITSNRVAALCAEEIIGVTLILIAGSSDLGLASPTVRSFNTIAILVSLLVHWDVIRGSINEASMIDYEGLVLAVNAF
ncbi:hypothetical protein BU17DRAFT_101986 [Hysterangium stoloniferum]|nr:hypothetical protein BU17DRAFT_101986 [Hysterangium stoloniferum]